MFGITTATISRSAFLLASRRTTIRAMSSPRDASSAPSKAGTPGKSAHRFNKDNGWAEETASESEAAVKADRDYHTGKSNKDDLKKLQKQSVKVLEGKDGKKTGKH